MKVTIDTCGESLDVVFDRLARMGSDKVFDSRVFSVLGAAIEQIERADDLLKGRIKATRHLVGDRFAMDISLLDEHRNRLSALKAELEGLKVIYEAPEEEPAPDEEEA
ncbi:hypothetical protein AH865_07905 [Salmonella enterica subsp. enterica serovar Infantis]|nr:hypothetical protein [Salmonella enterica subsp. enterica serovar Infantis]EGI5077975.1 hypothetical protein [Salmonella enterica subsp. enterica serovar Infantis]